MSWTNGDYYSGGVDAVAAAKAALCLAALGLAFAGFNNSAHRSPLPGATPILIFGYILVTVIGGYAAGSTVSSAVLAIRVLLIALIVLLVVAAHHRIDVISTLCTGMIIVGMALALSGLGTLASTGRLYGGFLPVNANQIAFLIGVPMLFLAWRLFHCSGPPFAPTVVSVLFVTTLLTGSRTQLLALILAMAVMIVQLRKIPVFAFLGSVALLPVLGFVLTRTSLLGEYMTRGNIDTFTTLSGRTVAWHAAFTMPRDFWGHWFGTGLATKTVPVAGQFWERQVIDSSWVNAFVQGGVVAIALLGLWALLALRAAWRTDRTWQILASSVVVYCLIASVTMSGLVGATSLFIVMLTTTTSTQQSWLRSPPKRGMLNVAHGLRNMTSPVR